MTTVAHVMWPPKFVRISKLRECQDPVAPAGNPRTYSYGSANHGESLPVSYSLDGWLLRLPQVGEPVLVLRFSRNGVVKPGVYQSTTVVDVPSDGEFVTQNSVYRWQEIASCPETGVAGY